MSGYQSFSLLSANKLPMDKRALTIPRIMSTPAIHSPNHSSNYPLVWQIGLVFYVRFLLFPDPTLLIKNIAKIYGKYFKFERVHHLFKLSTLDLSSYYSYLNTRNCYIGLISLFHISGNKIPNIYKYAMLEIIKEEIIDWPIFSRWK